MPLGNSILCQGPPHPWGSNAGSDMPRDRTTARQDVFHYKLHLGLPWFIGNGSVCLLEANPFPHSADTRTHPESRHKCTRAVDSIMICRNSHCLMMQPPWSLLTFWGALSQSSRAVAKLDFLEKALKVYI